MNLGKSAYCCCTVVLNDGFLVNVTCAPSPAVVADELSLACGWVLWAGWKTSP